MEMKWYPFSMELMFYADIHIGLFYLRLNTGYYVMPLLENQEKTYPAPWRRFAIGISRMCVVCIIHRLPYLP